MNSSGSAAGILTVQGVRKQGRTHCHILVRSQPDRRRRSSHVQGSTSSELNRMYSLRLYWSACAVAKGGKSTRNLVSISWEDHWGLHQTFTGHGVPDAALAPQDPLRKASGALQLKPIPYLLPLPLRGHVRPREERGELGTAAAETVPNSGLHLRGKSRAALPLLPSAQH